MGKGNVCMPLMPSCVPHVKVTVSSTQQRSRQLWLYHVCEDVAAHREDKTLTAALSSAGRGPVFFELYSFGSVLTAPGGRVSRSVQM